MSVLNRDLYNNALVHLGETVSSENTADYEERAPYLLGSFCSLAKATDKLIRKAEGLEAQSTFSPVFLGLDEQFPLCDSLAPAAAVYLAAMLVIDEDPALSDSLYDKYCDCMATFSIAYDISAGANCESITEKYFFD